MNIYDENVLDVFLYYPHQLWLDEGISEETMKKFEIGFHVYQNKITIPQRSDDGKLLGIRGRALNESDILAGKKYMPITIGNITYSTSTYYSLFGLHKTKEAIKRFKKVIIFEDEKSVLKCEDYFGEDNFAVSTYGANLSDYQVNLLLSLGVEEVFIARDREYKEYEETDEVYNYQEKLMEQAMKFVPYTRTYILFDKKQRLDYKDSPADKGKEVLMQLMKEKIEIKTKESLDEI